MGRPRKNVAEVKKSAKKPAKKLAKKSKNSSSKTRKLKLKNVKNSFLKIGKKYFIRTATYHHVGKLIGVTSDELLVSNASWVVESGRWGEILRNGDIHELEPFLNDVIINRGGIIDITEWTHQLPIDPKPL